MKNLFKVLELDEKDNLLSAFAKGGLQGLTKYTLISAPILIGMVLVGRGMTPKEIVETIEETTEAE